MANRGDVISVDKLWDIFDLEREKAWEGVEAPVGAPEWNVAAGKIDVINNICHAVHNMNTCSRSDGENAQKPVLKDGVSVVHSDYANGTAKTETQRWREWVCPVCGWFVGERLVHSHIGTHDQQKSNFCSRCGQKIDWEGVQDEVN